MRQTSVSLLIRVVLASSVLTGKGPAAKARAAGYTPLRLGPRILRTETAGLAALAALQTRWGDFGG